MTSSSKAQILKECLGSVRNIGTDDAGDVVLELIAVDALIADFDYSREWSFIQVRFHVMLTCSELSHPQVSEKVQQADGLIGATVLGYQRHSAAIESIDINVLSRPKRTLMSIVLNPGPKNILSDDKVGEVPDALDATIPLRWQRNDFLVVMHRRG